MIDANALTRLENGISARGKKARQKAAAKQKKAGAAKKNAKAQARAAKKSAAAAAQKRPVKKGSPAAKKAAARKIARKAPASQKKAAHHAAKRGASQKHFHAPKFEFQTTKSLRKLEGDITGGKVKRVPTGLPTLDKMLQGGLPLESITLLSGACGTGKSTLAMQFLYYGAKYCNEPGVYVTLEEDAERLVSNMTLFGWDIEKLVKEKKLLVIKPDVYKFDSIKQIIGDSIDKIGAKRLVVDSYSVMLTYFSDPDEIRNGLVQLDREIKKMGATAMVISDIKDNSEIFSTTGVEEFIVDGVIVLYLLKDPSHPYQSKRAISVRKMRATRHPLDYFDFSIGQRGVSVGGSNMTEIGPAFSKPPKARKRGRRAKKEPAKKKNSMIEVGALKAKGGHTWKWKHL